MGGRLRIDAKPKENGMLICLSGQFTFNETQQFKAIAEYARTPGIRFIEIDFAGVDFIDSAGLGMLLMLRDECIKSDIALSLHSARGQVEKIFNLSKFDQLFSS